MAKATAKAAKTKSIKTAEPEIPVRDAVDETAYQTYLDQAAGLAREYEKSTLAWYWKMGELCSNFLRSRADNRLGNRTLDHLIADLASQEITIAAPTLYCARQIYERYKLENISALVDAGVKVGHLKLLMPLDEALKTEAERMMLREDNTVVSIREFDAAIQDLKQQKVVQDHKKALEHAKAVKATPKGGPLPPREDEVLFGDDEDEKPKGKDAKAAEAEKAKGALKTPEKGEHRSTKSKEFSVNPLRAFKSFDKHGISTLAAIGDCVIAAAEGTKVGFDGERAQKNFREAFDGALGTAEQLVEALKEMIREMKSARKDV